MILYNRERGKMIKRLFTVVAAAFMLVTGLSGCDAVPSGYVGVQVNKYGDSKGVQDLVRSPGKYWSGPNTDMYLFPTFTITDKYTDGQSITFQAAGGISITVDIGVNYHIAKEDVPVVFQKYRRGADEISDTFLRLMIRDEMNRTGIKYEPESLQGPGKQKMLDEVIANVRKDAKAVGITVEDINYISDLRFPDSIRAAINAKIQATQEAMKVENELRRTQAENAKRVADAEAQVKVAKAEAEAAALKAQAAQQNSALIRLRELEIQEQWIKKWDGKQPQWVSGSGTQPMITIPSPTR